jgi:hypothetical protein
MTYEFLQEAQAELREATLAYESKESGLGIRFRNEIARVIERVKDMGQTMARAKRWVPSRERSGLYSRGQNHHRRCRTWP